MLGASVTAVTWSEFLRTVVLTTQVVSALLILLGVFLTALVTLKIARSNRASLERTAAERMEHDRRQAALDRTYDIRAQTFLDAMDWLRELDKLTEEPNVGDLGRKT